MGGVLGDVYGIRRPFGKCIHCQFWTCSTNTSSSVEVAFFLYIASSIYGALFLPEASADGETLKKNIRGVGDFFAPLKVIVPHQYRLEDGKVITNYGLIFLALGIFLGVVSSADGFGGGTTTNIS